ncbi:uncharacterized protein ColSpa_01222 [Colletotrichum spaethianum]|uniref:Uncharacterized protein n=1 Tax=Colletotrichum spaethianum TaxID=700344 RepID=A0AA37L3H1_9PEZI|nr:uncharacterized protein ColSpa_01222 [Colletotrichum spaethianum]GKT41041.1 hypothetical protein ColSpa_01222 [Colletotrichum spaethianum]
MEKLTPLTRTLLLKGVHVVPTRHSQSAAAPLHPLIPCAPLVSLTANPSIGPGGSFYRDFAHFCVYAPDLFAADRVLPLLEGVNACFVDAPGWRSTGLSYNAASDRDGPWTR